MIHPEVQIMKDTLTSILKRYEHRMNIDHTLADLRLELSDYFRRHSMDDLEWTMSLNKEGTKIYIEGIRMIDKLALYLLINNGN